MSIRYPIVPNMIVVHLGAPNVNARDITIPMTERVMHQDSQVTFQM